MIQQLLNTIQNNTDKKVIITDYLQDNDMQIACHEDSLNKIKNRLLEIKATLKRNDDFINGRIPTEQLHREFCSKDYKAYLVTGAEYSMLVNEFYQLRNEYIMILDDIQNIKDDVSSVLNTLRDNNIVYCRL